jgi:hypothetical protein
MDTTTVVPYLVCKLSRNTLELQHDVLCSLALTVIIMFLEPY